MIVLKPKWGKLLSDADSYIVLIEKQGVITSHTKGSYERIVARIFKEPVEEAQADKVLPKRVPKRPKVFPVLMKGK